MKLKEMYSRNRELIREKDHVIMDILMTYKNNNYMYLQATINFLEPLNIDFIKLIRIECYKWLPLSDKDKFINLVTFIDDRIGN